MDLICYTICMKQTILKRHGNYILRTRRIHKNIVFYTWHFSKELSNILKEYGRIEDWQFTNIENSLIQFNYGFYLPHLKQMRAGFRYNLKETQELYCIPNLLQGYYKTGKHASTIDKS